MYNTVTAQAKRITGMMSGMDTDSVVKGMMSGVQSKIDKQQQQKQTINWKKEAYQDIISKVNAFRDKYMNTLGESSLTRVGTFRSYTTTLSEGAEKYVKVTPSPNSQGSGLTIDSITQLATAGRVRGEQAVSNPITMKFAENSNIKDIAGQSIVVTLDGQRKTIKLGSEAELKALVGDPSAETITAKQLFNHMGSKMSDAFGSSRVSLRWDPAQNANGSYNVHVDVQDGSQLSIAYTGEDVLGDMKLRTALGVGDTSNRITMSSTLKSTVFATGAGQNIFENVMGESARNARFEINGVEFTIDENTTVSKLMNMVNSSDAGVTMSYSSVSDRFTIVSNDTGSAGDVTFKDLQLVDKDGNTYGQTTKLMATLFGVSDSTQLSAANHTQGQDAILEVDGMEIKRGSNTFSIDGYTIDLLAATPSGADPIKVSVANDTSKAMETIKEFVTEYNKLIEELNDLVNEKPTKGYTPLTDAQREALSDKEIERWETEAKKGLLYNDSEIRDMLTKMRTAFILPVEDENGKTGTFASIGISSSSIVKDWGKLILDEEKLQDSLTNNLDMVIKMFTNQSSVSTNEIRDTTDVVEKAKLNKTRQQESGLGFRFMDIVNSKTATTYLYEGSFVKLTGIGMAVQSNSTMSKNLKTIEDSIKRLTKQYAQQEERLYKRFAAMETALSRLESQSSYLFSGLSGS